MAVLRHLIARLSAETSGFQAGMNAAKKSLTEFNVRVSSTARSLASDLKGLQDWQREAALYQAKLRGMSSENINAARAILSQSEALNKSNVSLRGSLLGLKSIATLVRGGGVVLGIKLLAGVIRKWADSVSDARKQFLAAETTVHEMNLEMGKAIPILGGWVSLVSSIEEGLTGAKAESAQMVKDQEEILRLAEELKIAREPDSERQSQMREEIEHQRKMRALGTTIRDDAMRNRAQQLQQEINAVKTERKEREKITEEIQKQIKIQRDDLREAIAERKKNAQAERERRRARRESRAMWGDRFGAIGNFIQNDSFSGIRQRLSIFEAGRDFFKGWLSGGQEKSRESRSVPDPSSAAYGSSAAANIIARSTSSNQKRMADAIDELVRLTRARKPGVVVERGL